VLPPESARLTDRLVRLHLVSLNEGDPRQTTKTRNTSEPKSMRKTKAIASSSLPQNEAYRKRMGRTTSRAAGRTE
jgi:hypothetical protein